MAGLTKDCHTVEYGVPDGIAQLVSYPVGANQQLYSGAVALLSGSGSVTSGYLKNAASPGSSDLVVGIIGDAAGGTLVETGYGILGGSTDGAVWVNVRTGSFFIQNGASGSAVTEANVGKNVYYTGENSSGPVLSSTNTGSAYPTLGILLPQDPGIAGTVTPGSSYWPVKLNVVGGP
jgi:hypothetical protein